MARFVKLPCTYIYTFSSKSPNKLPRRQWSLVIGSAEENKETLQMGSFCSVYLVIDLLQVNSQSCAIVLQTALTKYEFCIPFFFFFCHQSRLIMQKNIQHCDNCNRKSHPRPALFVVSDFSSSFFFFFSCCNKLEMTNAQL